MKKILAIIACCLLLLAQSAFAETYYLSPTGSDKNPGTLAKPFATFKYAEGRLAAGDTVLVRGGTYANGCVIDVPNTTWQRYAEEEPLIDGEKVRPGNEWAPLVQITASGVTWDGINITRSTGYNLHIKAAYYGPRLTGITIINSKIYDSCHQNLVAQATSGLLIANCEFQGGNYTLRNGKGVGSSVVVLHSDTATVRSNIVREAAREGLIIGQNTRDSLVELNQFRGNRLCQLYLCNSQRITARFNWIQGWVDNNDLWLNRANAGTGIMIASETQWGGMASEDHQVHDNYVSGCRFNISLGTESGSTPVSGCKIFSNTLIDAQPFGDKSEHAGIYIGRYVGDGHQITHNTILQHDPPAILYSNGVTWDYNLWSTLPPAGAVGEHDPIYIGEETHP